MSIRFNDLITSDDSGSLITKTNTNKYINNKSEPDIKSLNKPIKDLENENNSLENKVLKTFNNPIIKGPITTVLNTVTSYNQNVLKDMKKCIDTEDFKSTVKTFTALTDADKVNHTPNYVKTASAISDNVRHPDSLLKNIAKDIVKDKSDLLNAELTNAINKLDNCASFNTKPDDKLFNRILSSLASYAAGIADCSNGNGIDFLACVSKGKYSDAGIKSSLTTVIMKKAEDKLHINDKTIDKISNNKYLRGLVKKSMSSKKVSNKVYKNKTKDNDMFKVGSDLALTFGNENISNIKTIVKKNGSNKKKNDFFLAGALKQAIATV